MVDLRLLTLKDLIRISQTVNEKVPKPDHNHTRKELENCAVCRTYNQRFEAVYMAEAEAVLKGKKKAASR